MQSSDSPSGGGSDRIYPAHTRQKTFARFIEVESWKHPEVAVLEPVMRGIESACKGIATLVRRAQCDEIQGAWVGQAGRATQRPSVVVAGA